jgi:hypothetical protein
MRDPHQNIFYYYRGPSKKQKLSLYDPQVEDNTTKSLINILEFCHKSTFDNLLNSFLKEINAQKKPIVTFLLQKGLDTSRPDAVIDFSDYKIHIESKVRAGLDTDQIKRHLNSIGSQDLLVVITNHPEHKKELEAIGDSRVRYLSWGAMHRLCRNVINNNQTDKKVAAVVQLIKHYVDYLEVVVMTEFNGFNDADFDYWIDPNPYYRPILVKKLEALAKIIRENLPKSISSKYSFIKTGNVSHSIKDERFAWVAIKRPKGVGGIFNQCNFTIEVSKSSLDVNAVVRNGRTYNHRAPLGVFYEKLSNNPNSFISTLRKIKRNGSLIVSRRLPKTGKRIMPGNEKWVSYFEIRIDDISSQDDVRYICDILKKADSKPGAPGIHICHVIDRGNDILTKPDRLKDEIIAAIIDFKPVLDFLEK